MWEKTGPTPARLDSRIEQYVKVFFHKGSVNKREKNKQIGHAAPQLV